MTILDAYNLVILYTKYYVYISKKKKQTMHLYDFLLGLKQELHLKKMYYNEHNRLRSFDKKWGELYNNL